MLDLRLSFACITLAAVLLPATAARADSFVIPFSDIRADIEASPDDPDAVIHAYLAGLLRDELEQQGFSVDSGLVFTDVPLDAMTSTIATDCDFPQPYKVHTDATTATITLDDSSTLVIALDSIRSIDISAQLTGIIDTEADAWVRWGQDVPLVGDCKTIDTDHGWVGLTLPFGLDLGLSLQLDPVYDPEQVAIVVDKSALLAGQVQFFGGDLDHEFGPVSLTDVVIDAFEDDLLDALDSNGQQAVAEAIATMNYRLDGLDETGQPDPTITAFNGPTTFSLSTTDEDQAFIRDLLEQLGIPELVLAMVEDRGVEILLQLVVLEGAERDAYLASLGAEVGCDALLGAYQAGLGSVPLYTQTEQGCAVADLDEPAAAGYFADADCASEVAYSPTDAVAYCQAQFGPGAESLLGNAASWSPDPGQPGDELPGIPSLPWTTVPTTELDLGVVPLTGNQQPFMKQVGYRTLTDTGGGNGSCALEMRVYKRDIAGQGLRPLIALHGGTWQHRGSSFMGLEAGVSQFTERGFIVFAPFYRLVGDSDGNVECNGVSWREVTADAEAALDWVNQHGAALGALQEPVSVFGQSAGAHLAAWLAANRGADVRRALINYGPTDALDFLSGAVPPGGPYEAYRDFGIKALGRFFGAQKGAGDLHLEQIDFAGLTAANLGSDWATLIPGSAFDLSGIDPLVPPVYVGRCAAATLTDLAAINLALPPPELISCMQQELADFLVANSFNHQFETSTPPVFIVHGSGDTIVPHQQAIGLCGAIDGSVLPTDVVDPLTVYACGNVSEAHIVRDADHALELGACLGPLCPAGPVGSETRQAVAAALLASYAWLQEDDTDRDGVPDDQDAFPDDPDEWVDTDGDGVGNNADTDDDDDGVSDDDELAAGSNPLEADTDGDSQQDGVDNCPVVSNPDQYDADRDGLGNACDAANALAPSDYDGDGRSDILWRHSATGQVYYWQMNGATTVLEAVMANVGNLDWRIAGTGDYNGDGHADILWRHKVSGQVWMYLMNDSSIIANAGVGQVSDLDWRIAGSGDYNGDGKADILWRHAVSGQNWMYFMNGASIAGSAGVSTVPNPDAWTVAGNGDYDGDGKSDILWRNGVSGTNWVYLMDGASIRLSASVSTISDPLWAVAGSGDYNGDGRSDVLWRHQGSGQNWVYLMNGNSIESSSPVSVVPDPQNWIIVGNGDYNGDGTADVLWRNLASGSNWMYLMNGSTILAGTGVATEPDLDRKVVNVD